MTEAMNVLLDRIEALASENRGLRRRIQILNTAYTETQRPRKRAAKRGTA
jgi:hypothetical protein